jgi:[protein-PII] uridylyltransferase
VVVLDAETITAPPGRAWCAAWTVQVDDALRSWLAAVEPRGGVAVVALGGYARRELCPASDVDLLLVHDHWPRDRLEALVQGLCYPLWDAGLAVGHAVRTGREAVRAAEDDITTATALTDRRLVAGDVGLFEDLASRAARWARRTRARLLPDLAAANAARHTRAGAYPGMLEPHLKDGAGGLRDVHSLRWAAGALLGDAGLDPLVGARYLGAQDRRRLTAAADALLAARCALHAAHGGGARHGSTVDVLRLDLHDDVAGRLGLDEADTLLREVGLAMRTVAHIADRTWPRLLADARDRRRRVRAAPVPLADDVTLVDGLVEIAPAASLAQDPALGMRVVAAAARSGTHVGRATVTRLQRELNGTRELPWSEDVRAHLLDVLRAGRRGLGALADADHLGLLQAHLPAWPTVRGRRQRNPFHRYDLDTHGAQTVAELMELAAGEHGALWQGLDDHELVLLGAWLHDIGKAWPGDHSVVGAHHAAVWVTAMGFGEAGARRVAGLVRDHLLLPQVAAGRDLDDPAEIMAVAARVGDVQSLDALYLLSLADARATGPTAHSPWRDALLATLHARARSALTTGAPAATRSPNDAAGGRDDAVSEPYWAIRPGPADGVHTIVVRARDRHALFADCAGVLAAAGAVVLDARADTASDGLAQDRFVARLPDGLDHAALGADLDAALRGALDVPTAVARRERRRSQAPPVAVPAAVTVEVAGDGRVTRVEATGPDAPGALYRLASVLSGAGLDIRGARVTTLGATVRDVFFVQGPPDPVDVAALRAQLCAALTRG